VGVPVSVVVFDSIERPTQIDVDNQMNSPIVPISTYLRVFAALVVLLVVTVAVAQVHLGILNTPIAMLIALVKAAMIVLFFMHVRNAPPLVRVFAAGGFLWLAIMFIFTFSDVLTRH
jgi:cytochrome c oxidase subunit 4